MVAEERKVMFTRQLTRIFQPHLITFGFSKIKGNIEFNTIDLSQFSLTNEETLALKQKALAIDQMISIQHDQCVRDICTSVDNFIADICVRVKNHLKGIQSIKPIRCGSTPARVKCGFPLENDYVLLINAQGSPEIDDIFQLIKCKTSGTLVRDNDVLLKIQKISLGKVAICLKLEVMTHKRKHETVSFSVDLVPARISTKYEKQQFQASRQLKRFVRVALKRNELKNEGISSFNSDLISLLSPKRDSKCDAGLYMHKLCKGLSAYHKQELRIAKFLVSCATYGDLVNIDKDLSPDVAEKFYSYDDTCCPSFYVSLCFYTVLFDTFGTDKEITSPGMLAITVVKSLSNALGFFASSKQRDPLSTLWFEHPFFENTSYTKKTCLYKVNAEIMHQKLDRVIAFFMNEGNIMTFLAIYTVPEAKTMYRMSDNFIVDPNPSEVLDLNAASLQKYLFDADVIDSIETLVNDQTEDNINILRDDSYNTDIINQCSSIAAITKPDPCHAFATMLGKVGSRTETENVLQKIPYGLGKLFSAPREFYQQIVCPDWTLMSNVGQTLLPWIEADEEVEKLFEEIMQIPDFDKVMSLTAANFPDSVDYDSKPPFHEFQPVLMNNLRVISGSSDRGYTPYMEFLLAGANNIISKSSGGNSFSFRDLVLAFWKNLGSAASESRNCEVNECECEEDMTDDIHLD